MLRPVLLILNVCASIGLIATGFQSGWAWGAAALAHGLLFFAIMHPCCDWLGPVVTSFRTEKKEVWLTIDDGPDGLNTRQLAAELAKRNVLATFFFVGDRLAAPGLVREVKSTNHRVGHHTKTHPQGTFWCAGRKRIQREIREGFEALAAVGVETTHFRSPVGHKPPALHKVLREHGLLLIGWSVNGYDSFSDYTENVVRRVRQNIFPGAILLLHEGRTQSVKTILAVVDALIEDGYQFVIPSDEQLQVRRSK